MENHEKELQFAHAVVNESPCVDADVHINIHKDSEEAKIKEEVLKTFAKADKKPSKYDKVCINKDIGTLICPNGEISYIKNAWIFAENPDTSTVQWEFKDFEPVSVPYNMTLVIKPGKTAALVYSNGDNEEYLLIKSDTEYIHAKIMGIIETNSMFIAFNAENNKVYNIYQLFQQDGENIHLYSILKSFLDWGNTENNNKEDKDETGK